MKSAIRYSLFFVLLYCAPITQFTFWAVILVFPFLFFGNPINSHNCSLNHLIRIYILLSFVTLITGLISPDLYRPVKDAFLMLGASFVSWCVFYKINNIRDLKTLNDGVILAALLFCVIVAMNKIHEGFTFDYSDEGESWLGKNLLALNFYSGAVCSTLNYFITKKTKYYGALGLITIFILLSTSLKIIVSTIFLVFLSFTMLNRWSKIYIALFLMIFIPITSNIFIEYFSSREWIIIQDRLLTLFGLGEYATTEMGFIDRREDLLKAALNILYEHPFGVGLENTRLYMGTYSHNTYIELVCGSFILLFLFLLFIGEILKTLIIYIKYSTINLFSFGIFFSILFVGSAMKIYDNSVAIFLLVLLYRATIIFGNEFKFRLRYI